MQVRFQKNEQMIEYGMTMIPRIGDFVQLDQFVSGNVIKVQWRLGDDRGFVRTNPYVVVVLS